MRTLAVVFASLLIAGCSQQPSAAVKTGPTYAEAVGTYQAEVALLDSLLAKRKAIEDEYSASVSRDRSSFAYTNRHAAAFDDAARQVGALSLGSVESLVNDETKSDDLRESFKKLLAVSRRTALVQIAAVDKQISKQKEMVRSAEIKRNELASDR